MTKKYNDSGVLFKNDRKESDNHPDYKGSAMVDGIEYWLAAWIKKSQNGQNYMSLSFTVKENKSDEARKAINPKKERQQVQDEFDDDIPF